MLQMIILYSTYNIDYVGIRRAR